MATRIPTAASLLASQATSGVLPVPPTVRLPITTTGTPTFTRWRNPIRYSTLRNAITAPYTRRVAPATAGRLPLYHIFSRREGMRRGQARNSARLRLA